MTENASTPQLPESVSRLLPRHAVLFVDRLKRPMTRHGWEDATKDLDELTATYQRLVHDRRFDLPPEDDNARLRPVQPAIQPRQSGYVILDVDPRNFEPGVDPLVEFLALDPDLLDTFRVDTPGGGNHYYYQAPPAFVEVPSVTLRPGVELKGDTGYVLIPPDLGPTDEHRPYRRAEGSPPAILPFPVEIFEHLIASRTGPGYSGTSQLGYTTDLGEILRGEGHVKLGERDHTFYALACRLRGANTPIEDAARALQAVWEHQTPQPADDVYPADAVLRKLRRVYDTFEPDATPAMFNSAASLVRSAQSQLALPVPGQAPQPHLPADVLDVEGSEDTDGTVPPATPLNEPNLIELHPDTDLGFVERFLDRHGTTVRHTDASGQGGWYVYQPDRGTWTTVNAAGTVQRLIGEVAVDTWFTERDLVGEAALPALRRYCERFQSGAGVETAMRLIARDERVAVAEEDFDASAGVLVVRNGIVHVDELETSEPNPITFGPQHLLSGHDPALLSRRRFELNYSSDEECPAWDNFLETTLPDPALRAYVRSVIGYALSGRGTEKSLFLILGPTNTGKSVFISALRAVFDEYTTVLAPDAVLDRKGEDPDNRDLVGLPGKRFAFIPEIPANRQLQAARLKMLASGSDALRAARKYGQPFEFVNRAALFITGNARPRVDDVSVWDRARLIPFVHQVPREEQLAESVLISRFRQESAGILNWALRGLAEWKQNGFIIPDAVRNATSEWQDMEDWLSSFLGANCVTGTDKAVAASTLYAVYLAWLAEESDRGQPLSRNAFARALTNGLTSFRRRKLAGVTVYEGVGLQDGVDTPAPQAALNPATEIPSNWE